MSELKEDNKDRVGENDKDMILLGTTLGYINE